MIAVASAIALALAGLVTASTPAHAQACSAGVESDFDGDQKPDLAIGDPNATVSGIVRAGRVHIAYGDGGTQTITPGSIPDNDNGAHERFGFAMDSTDWNGDGCSDLFVGAPFEMWASGTPEVGVAFFIPGSPSGLDTAQAKIWTQTTLGVDNNEAGDRFGYDLAAGRDTAGKPFLVVGMPGESTITAEGAELKNIGQAIYARPDAAVDFNQNSTGIADAIEDGDMFGYSVTASESGFAVGIPGESAGALEYAGTVNLFAHNNATTVPTQIAAWGQGSPEINDHYDAGDMYGYSVDMVDYISTTGGAPRMMIAVGAPGETIGTRTSAGLSMVMWSAGTGITEYRYLYQDVDGNAADGSERGDAFGAAVAMVNRTPGQNTSANTLLLAVGVPGEDADGRYEVGETQLFSMTEDAAQQDNPVRPELPAALFTPASGAALGQVLHATQTHLFVTATGGTGPAVYRVPWGNIVAGGTGAVTAYTPETFGLADTDTVSFGASLA